MDNNQKTHILSILAPRVSAQEFHAVDAALTAAVQNGLYQAAAADKNIVILSAEQRAELKEIAESGPLMPGGFVQIHPAIVLGTLAYVELLEAALAPTPAQTPAAAQCGGGEANCQKVSGEWRCRLAGGHGGYCEVEPAAPCTCPIAQGLPTGECATCNSQPHA